MDRKNYPYRWVYYFFMLDVVGGIIVPEGGARHQKQGLSNSFIDVQTTFSA